MSQATISIPIDADIADAYAAVGAEQQRKIQLLLRLRLRDLTSSGARPLTEVMDEIGTRAEERGLTPELLAELLDGE